jgi:hypothetical protein
MASSAGSDCFDVCDHCGSRLVGTDWFPARTSVGADGTVVIRSFCDEGCLSAWDGPA